MYVLVSTILADFVSETNVFPGKDAATRFALHDATKRTLDRGCERRERHSVSSVCDGCDGYSRECVRFCVREGLECASKGSGWIRNNATRRARGRVMVSCECELCVSVLKMNRFVCACVSF